MRVSSLLILAGAGASVSAQLMEKDTSLKKTTVFNNIKVPPLLELTPTNWATEKTRTKFLMVKHYSPYCPHCIDFAPTYQTMYEFYFTIKTDLIAAAGQDFMDYYDFRFGMINCVAYYDLCVDNGVQSYPTTVLFEDGEVLDTVRGGKDMNVLGLSVEQALEKYKPDTRPEIVSYPGPGSREFPGQAPKPDLRGEGEPLAEGVTNKGKGKGSAAIKAAEKELAEQASQAESQGEKIVAPDEEPAQKPVVKKEDERWDKSRSDRFEKSVADGFSSPTPGENFNDRKPKKPVMSPNPNGVSVSLTAESFQKLVTMTQDPWFIKFYAPWCPHCQSMAPTWDQLGKNMQGKLNIGEVNCDKESRLCKDVQAKSFPTLLFFKGGERAEYRGLRGLGDFVKYADNALELSRGVPDVTAEDFATLEQKEDVIFIYFYDHATTTEDLTALERIPLSLVGHAKLVKTNDPKLYDRFKITTWPRLLVARDGRPTYFTPLIPDAIRDVRGVLDWMRSVWLPLVPEVTASNARQIMNGKIVALAVLDPKNQVAFQGALKELKTSANEWMDRQIQEFQIERKKLRDAKQMRIEEAQDRDDQRALNKAKGIRIDMDNSGRKEVGFAWVDGVFWQRWIRQTYGIDVADGERIIVNDEDSRQYWDNTVTGNYILVSRTSIMETLDKIVYGPNPIKPKLTVSVIEKILHDIKTNFFDHPFLSIGCMIGISFGVFSWLRTRRRSRGGHFRLNNSVDLGHFQKEGLLGQNGTKAD